MMTSKNSPTLSEIRGDAHSVSFLLEKKYRIDYYQRDYGWETKQIRELVEDLTTGFDQNFNPKHKRESVRQYGHYFLGSILISEKGNERYIVDGQQRLVSLTLLLIHLDRLQSIQDPARRVDVTKLIYSTKYGRASFNFNVSEWDTCLNALCNGESPDPTGQLLSVQNLINRFKDIVEIFPDQLQGTKLSYFLPYFLDWLIEKVMLVQITAFSDDNAYTIFETMNDRGLSLAPTEMLKGYLLDHIEDKQKRSEAEKEWNSQIVALRNMEKDKDEAANCIKAWLRSQHAQKIREKKSGAKSEDFERQGTDFHRWVRENAKPIGLSNDIEFSSFVTKNFCFYAKAYADARYAADNYEGGLTSIFFNAQNNFTLQYPLMLAPLQLTDGPEIVQRKMSLVATYIEIMLARRMWNFKAINHSAMKYRAFQIMKGIRNLELVALRDNLVHRLSREGAELSREGAEQDDYVDFQTQEVFSLRGNNGPQVHRLLARLTEFLEIESNRSGRYFEYANRSGNKDSYQIEHLWANHPQQHEEEFPNPSDFKSYRNRIGGLVLLPAQDNKSYSDMPYSDKVENYAKQNLLACSLHPTAYKNNPGFEKFLTATKLLFAPKETFKKADLDDRQALYIKLANLCWSPNRLNDI